MTKRTKAFEPDAITTADAANDLRERVERDHGDNPGAVYIAQMIYSTLVTAEIGRMRIAYIADSLQRTAKRIKETAEAGGFLGRSEASIDTLDSLRQELLQHDADMGSARRLVAALNAIIAAE